MKPVFLQPGFSVVRVTGEKPPFIWTEVPDGEAAELLRRFYNDCAHDCGEPSAAYLLYCINHERLVILHDGYPASDEVAYLYELVQPGGVVPVITLKRPDKENQMHKFTEADRVNSRLAARAHNAARKRLVTNHRDEFRMIEDEERAKLGLPPRKRSMPLGEMKRLAELAIEHGLGTT